MAAFDFHSPDGTRIRGWRNDGDGLPVVISNGLGTPPAAWPVLTRPDSGYRVMTWYYRGSGGSDRPVDPSRIRIEHHVDDMVALLDHEGVDRALVACWSMGVNIAFEFAARHPDRVAGLLAVAGVPGGTFRAMFGPVRRLPGLRHYAGRGVAQWARWVGPQLDRVAALVPVNRRTAWMLAHTGFMSPRAKASVVVPALEEFRTHDFRWYFTLALAGSEHAPMDLAFVQCPTTLVAGRWDIITSIHAMVEAADRIPHARLEVLGGTHFLPLEFPDECVGLLHELAEESDLKPVVDVD